MIGRPTGTVTFLFTDIEGSTALWEQQPGAMQIALERHHAILREAVEAQHGVIFNVAGDGLCAAFASAGAAFDAALSAQRALHQTDWGATIIRVRMGLHTGAVEADAGGYRSGPTLNRAARIMSVAQGGQVLLSQTTAELLREQLLSGVTLRDLGLHRLKGLAEPERLLQVVTPDLPSEFPAMRSASATPNNLPVQLTSFIGREEDLAELQRLLTTTRLLTLSGSGGVGKTRLAQQLAQAVLPDFPDGAWLIELAPLSDPSLIAQTIASALGLREQPGQALLALLREHLRSRTTLLLLDNCEHLIAEVATVADALLHAAPQLRIVASSREALGIAGELAWRVPSLEVPTADGRRQTADGNGQSDWLSYAAMRLFLERASFANAAFRVTDANVSAIAQICARLDGIPLAIELAAARVKAMRVEQIAERLDDRFRLLTGGSRTALPRQQTLRGTIDWSYSLLSEPERILLRRLAVFAGGWTLEAAEQVCGKVTGDRRWETEDDVVQSASENRLRQSSVFRLPSKNVLDPLTRLVDKSLVVLDEQAAEPRYWMLESVRQYARERLLDADESVEMRAMHALYLRRLAEEAEPCLRDAGQSVWWRRVNAELDNLRAAIEWSLHGGTIGEGAAIVSALWNFWHVNGFFSEANSLAEHILSRPDLAQQSRLRALMLNAAGFIKLWMLNASEQAQPLFEEAWQIGRSLNDAWVMDVATAYRAVYLTGRAILSSDFVFADTTSAQNVARWRAAGDAWFLGFALINAGNLAQARGDEEQARGLYEESVALLRQIDEKNLLANPLRMIGYLVLRQRAFTTAAELFSESLRLNLDVGERVGISSCLSAFAALALAQGDAPRTTRLFGAMQTLLQSIEAAPPIIDLTEYQRNVALARAALAPDAFEAAWAEGRALTQEQAIALAQQPIIAEPPVQPTTQAPATPADPSGLTARERDVLRLLDEGLSNDQIAEQLVVSTFTVRAHLRAIYDKLDVGTRTAAVHAARERGLV